MWEVGKPADWPAEWPPVLDSVCSAETIKNCREGKILEIKLSNFGKIYRLLEGHDGSWRHHASSSSKTVVNAHELMSEDDDASEEEEICGTSAREGVPSLLFPRCPRARGPDWPKCKRNKPPCSFVSVRNRGGGTRSMEMTRYECNLCGFKWQQQRIYLPHIGELMQTPNMIHTEDEKRGKSAPFHCGKCKKFFGVEIIKTVIGPYARHVCPLNDKTILKQSKERPDLVHSNADVLALLKKEKDKTAQKKQWLSRVPEESCSAVSSLAEKRLPDHVRKYIIKHTRRVIPNFVDEEWSKPVGYVETTEKNFEPSFWRSVFVRGYFSFE